MKIGYKKIWGVLCFMLILLNCCLTAAFVQIDGAAPPAFAGFFWVSILYGILLLTRNYIEIGKGTLLIKSLTGLRTKRYVYRSVNDFSIEKDRVFIMNNGTRQKLPVALWLVDKRGWASFLDWIKAGDQENEQG